MHEPEELELINELRKTTDIHNLTQMLRSGDMKEFYKTAERVLRVKPASPVVMKITTDNDEVIDDKDDVDRHIKEYFEAIYKAPEEWVDRMVISENTLDNSQRAYFSTIDIEQAMSMCNFNKGVGPDGFDGNILKNNEQLRQRIVNELSHMMSQCRLPEYMRQGRLVPLSKVKESNNVKVEDIRPIVVRSHLSKIVEKALLERIRKHSWHLLETQYY